jgi:hypothetical protein
VDAGASLTLTMMYMITWALLSFGLPSHTVMRVRPGASPEKPALLFFVA